MEHHQQRSVVLRSEQDRDRGAVTAEFAVLMPAILIVIVMILVVGIVGSAHVRNHDAARQGARLRAAGESAEQVRQTARTVAGPDAAVTLTHEGEWVSVTVSRRPAMPGGWSLPFTLTATAFAWNEDQRGGG